MRKRILVIDDDESILELISEILTRQGLDVETLSDPNELFQRIRDYKPDLVIIDYLLSGINGGEFCHQIKTNVNTAHLPVIMISASPRTFLSLGNYSSDLFIAKPFDIDDFVAKVNSCIRPRRAFAL